MNALQYLQLAIIALNAAAAAEKAAGNNSAILGYIATASTEAEAGIAAYQQAASGVDPSKLNPIDPIA